MVDAFAKILDAISKLISAVAWPLVAAVIIWSVAPSLGDFVKNMDEGKVKAGDFEISGKRREKAVATIAAADVAKGGAGQNPAALQTAIQDAVASVQKLPSKGLSAKRVLWVDDKPTNNVLERESLELLGAQITLAQSTDAALGQLDKSNFDLIISDLGRPEGPTAGFDLYDKIRQRGVQTPFIIYSASSTQHPNANEARTRGVRMTSSPSKLVDYATSIIRDKTS